MVRKAKAWAACHQIKKIWKAGMYRDLKIRLFVATVESILLYGAETWTMSQTLAKRIDGCYTMMLRMALNIHWSERRTNAAIYGNLQRASEKIATRRTKLAGHLARNEDLLAHQLLFCEPSATAWSSRQGEATPHVR